MLEAKFFKNFAGITDFVTILHHFQKDWPHSFFVGKPKFKCKTTIGINTISYGYSTVHVTSVSVT